MTFLEAIKICFKEKITKREGRARRSEFWYFQLFNVIVAFGFGIISIITDMPDAVADSVARLLNFVFLIPGINVAVRRLHDVNKSGWWYFINFTIIGIFYFLYLMAKEGDRCENQYGPDPKGDINGDIESTAIVEKNDEIEKMGGDSVI